MAAWLAGCLLAHWLSGCGSGSGFGFGYGSAFGRVAVVWVGRPKWRQSAEQLRRMAPKQSWFVSTTRVRVCVCVYKCGYGDSNNSFEGKLK